MSAEVVGLTTPPRPTRIRKRPAKVIRLSIPTRQNIRPDRVLRAALGKLEDGMVLGFTKEGEFYAAASFADGADALWLMELCKLELMQVTPRAIGQDGAA